MVPFGTAWIKRCRKLIGKAQNNPRGLRFAEMEALCRCAGMTLDRISGSHHIYVNRQSAFQMSIQRADDGKAKPYQVRQVLSFIEEFDLERRD